MPIIPNRPLQDNVSISIFAAAAGTASDIALTQGYIERIYVATQGTTTVAGTGQLMINGTNVGSVITVPTGAYQSASVEFPPVGVNAIYVPEGAIVSVLFAGGTGASGFVAAAAIRTLA